MRQAQRVSKRIRLRTPGGRNVWHFKERRVSHATCKNCGCKLNRARLNRLQIKKLSKSEKRPNRPFPELCSRCMREKLKQKVK